MQRVLQFARARFPSGEINPVVVKELRQVVRNWSVIGMLIVFLIVLFGAMMIPLLGHTVSHRANQALGREILSVFLPITIFFSLLFIPIYVGVRLAIERQTHNVDLLYITTLAPGRIIRGKLYCGIYITVLFYAVCLPFIVFTNLLRGVDLPSIFIVLAMNFLATVAAIQAAILIACVPATKGFKTLLAAPALVFIFPISGFMSFGSIQMISSGIGTQIWTRDFWEIAGSVLGVGMLGFGLVYLLSVALISPPTANRALPIRLYVAGSWLLTLGLAGVLYYRTGDDDFPVVWAVTFVCIYVATLVIAVSEGDDLSVRIRRTIPRRWLPRWVTFLFYSGSAGGLTWTVLLGLGTLLALTTGFGLIEMWGASGTGRVMRSMPANTEMLVFIFLLYTLAYALFGLWIHRKWFAHRTPLLAGFIAMILPGLWAIIPNLVLFFSGRLEWDALGGRQLGSPFNLFTSNWETHLEEHFYCALIMVGVAVLINLGWYLRQLRAFKPYQRGEAPPAGA